MAGVILMINFTDAFFLIHKFYIAQIRVNKCDYYGMDLYYL